VSEDGRLLRQYREQGSEAAFARLAARHLGFVYATCLREAGNAVLAEEATQVVFLLLARKAPPVRSGQSLSGWLFQTARFAARNARRREERRKRWEERAVEQMPSAEREGDALWDHLSPTVNDALASLGAKDREAVLLRFAEGLNFPELGAALGTSEDAARMRLNRAVERLRRFFAKQGVTLSGAVLIGLLADRTVQAAPAPCAAAVAKIAGSAAAGAGSAETVSPDVYSQLQGALKAMMTTKLKLAAVIAVTVTLAATLPFVTRAQDRAGRVAPLVTGKTTPPPPLSSFLLPDARSGGGSTTDNTKITTYASPRSYEEVCRFYAESFLSRDFTGLGSIGVVTGDKGNQSGYALRPQRGAGTAVFYRSMPAYTVSAFISRGAGEATTQVTLVYETK